MENKSFSTSRERGLQRLRWNTGGTTMLYAHAARGLGDRALCACAELYTRAYTTLFKAVPSSPRARLFSEKDDFWWGAQSTMKEMSRQIKSRGDIIPRGDRRQLHSLVLALPWKSFRAHRKINTYVTEQWVDSIATAGDREREANTPSVALLSWFKFVAHLPLGRIKEVTRSSFEPSLPMIGSQCRLAEHEVHRWKQASKSQTGPAISRRNYVKVKGTCWVV